MKRIYISAALLIIILTMLPFVDAHSGRTDKDGCHYDKKTGDYHCHNSGSSSTSTTTVPTSTTTTPVSTTIVPTPTATAIPKSRIEITSDPSGADIYIDEELKGKTPKTIELYHGNYTIDLKLVGHEDSHGDISVPDMTESWTQLVAVPTPEVTKEVDTINVDPTKVTDALHSTQKTSGFEAVVSMIMMLLACLYKR